MKLYYCFKKVSYIDIKYLVKNTYCPYLCFHIILTLNQHCMTKPIILLLLCFLSVGLYGQELTVRGTVLDGNGEPIEGAAVLVKDSMKGEMTDADGRFTLDVRSGDILVASMLGYRQVELPASETMTIVLEPDMNYLEDAVVIGYGAVRKSDLTGSVSSIKAEDLSAAPSHSIDYMLRGKAAGLTVYTGSNEPGASATIRIRGTSSIHGSNDPLYVVDGFPVGSAGNLKAISPDDVESIEVLKDASAAAIYGSRGANGVIIVTTKKGREGRPEISFSSKTGLSTFAKPFDIITDPALYATLDNESYINGGGIPRYVGDYYDGVYYPSVQEIRDGTWKYSTDWADEIYRLGITQDYNLSVSGSKADTQYSVSLGYFDQTGIQIGSDYQKITSRVNLKQKVTKWLSIGVDAFINKVNNHQTANVNVGRTPVFPVYDEEGNYFMLNSQDYYHPIALVDNVLNKGKSFDFYGMASMDIRPFKDLVIRAQIGYNSSKSTTDSYQPRTYTSSGELNNGVGSISDSEGDKVLPEVYATYTHTFGTKHDLSVMAGFTAEITQSRALTGTGMGFVNDVLQNEDLHSATTYDVSNSYSKSVLNSWIARVNYTYANKWLLTFTARADGCSKFGANNKWGFFPSGALSWKMHEEPFMANLRDYISETKFRVSYGLTGNQGISAYQTLERIGNATNYYLNGNGFVTGYGPGIMSWGQNYTRIWEGLANKDLRWETTRQFNVGLDFGMFDDRLQLTFDWYHKYTVDLLRQSWLAPSTGSDRMWVNNGEVVNRGWEISLSGVLISNKDFHWDMGVIFAHNHNFVKKLEFFDDQGGAASFEYRDSNDDNFGGIGCSILQIGQPMGVFYGYLYDGIMQTAEEGEALGLTGIAAAPGEQKFKNVADVYDENGNPVSVGKLGAEDRVIIGNPEPDFTFSLNTSLAYKGFDLSLNFNGCYGNEIFNKALQSSAKAKVQRWTPDNTDTRYPRLRNGKVWYVSDYFIEDGSYIKLSYATFGYTYRFKNSFISKARAYVTGENLFTVTKFSGYDPEVAANGIFYGGYPKQRVFTIGVNLTF